MSWISPTPTAAARQARRGPRSTHPRRPRPSRGSRASTTPCCAGSPIARDSVAQRPLARDAARLARGREFHRADDDHLALRAAALPAGGGIVPAVTEVCNRQPAHSQARALVLSAQAFPPPHPGQAKPSGRRFCARCAAQAATSGNRVSSWARESGRSCFQRLDAREHYRNTQRRAGPAPHILRRRNQPERPPPYFDVSMIVCVHSAAVTPSAGADFSLRVNSLLSALT